MAQAKALPCFSDAVQKARVMFQPVVEPVIFCFKADEYSGGFSMPGDDNLLVFSQPQVY